MARPIDSRKFIKTLRREAADHGLMVELEPRRGAGSHYFVIIIKPGSPKRATFTLKDDKEISPGVQRQIVSWCKELAKECTVHAAVYEILKNILGI